MTLGEAIYELNWIREKLIPIDWTSNTQGRLLSLDKRTLDALELALESLHRLKGLEK